METQEFEQAKEDFNRAQHLDPGNAAVRRKRQELKQRQSESDAKLAAAIKKMFP
jgi:multidrug resistance efflux pump